MQGMYGLTLKTFSIQIITFNAYMYVLSKLDGDFQYPVGYQLLIILPAILSFILNKNPFKQTDNSFLNSLYYSNKLVTSYAYYRLMDVHMSVCKDIQTYPSMYPDVQHTAEKVFGPTLILMYMHILLYINSFLLNPCPYTIHICFLGIVAIR